MKRFITVMVAAVAFALAVALPAQGGEHRTVQWVCDVPNVGEVVFLSVPEEARGGIEQANATAGQLAFLALFGEHCSVQ